MKINKISQAIQRMAKRVSANEKMYDKMNNVILPIGETTIATGMYALFIEKKQRY